MVVSLHDPSHAVHQATHPRVAWNQGQTAKQYLDTTLNGDALAWRNSAAIVETSAVIPLVHRLMAAGFNVFGERAVIEGGPRLYVHDGKWGLYTAGPGGGRVIAKKLSSLILMGAGKPN